MSDWDDSGFHQNLAWVLLSLTSHMENLIYFWQNFMWMIWEGMRRCRRGEVWQQCQSVPFLTFENKGFSLPILCLVLTKKKKKKKKQCIKNGKSELRCCILKKVFHFSLNFSFMELTIFFWVSFWLGIKPELQSCIPPWNKVLVVPSCSAKPAWAREDGTAKSTVADSTFMSWSHLLCQNVNFNTCITPEYFIG